LVIVCVVPYVAAQAALDVERATVDLSTYMPSFTTSSGCVPEVHEVSPDL
jgi:hypothetical protein